jgi:hypothetical protein
MTWMSRRSPAAASAIMSAWYSVPTSVSQSRPPPANARTRVLASSMVRATIESLRASCGEW